MNFQPLNFNHALLKAGYLRVIDVYYWGILFILGMGGIRLPNGHLKFTYPKDLLFIGAILYGLGKIGLKISFRETSIYRVFDSGFQSLPFFNPVISLGTWKPKKSGVFILTLIFWFSFCFCLFPILRHHSFGTGYWDMGILENSIFNGAHTGTFFTYLIRVTGEQPLHFFPNNRLDFWLYPIAGLYRLFPETEFLLLLQSVAFLLGVFPFVKLARKFIPDHFPTWLAVVFYFTFDSFHRINFWDFHEAAFLITFGLWAIYFIEEKRVGLSLLMMFCAATWREDAWLAFSAYSLLLGLRTGRWKLALPLFLFGLAVLPLYAANLNLYNHLQDRYSYLGTSLKLSLPLLVHHPLLLLTPFKRAENIQFLWGLVYRGGFGSFLFAGLPSFLVWIPLSELVMSDKGEMPYWRNHYVAIAIPLILYCTLVGWRNLQAFADKKISSQKGALFPVLFVLSISQLSFLEPSWIRNLLDADQTQINCMKTIVKEVPHDAAVISDDPFVAQLSNREKISYLTYPPFDGAFDLMILSKEKATPYLARLNEKRPSDWMIKGERCGFVIAQKANATHSLLRASP